MEKSRDNVTKHIHSNRTEETRMFEIRENFKRRVMNMRHKDPLYVDPEEIPEGMEYLWIRKSVHGVPDESNMVNMRSSGWSFVPSSRHPQMVFEDIFGNSSAGKGYIERTGLILCERPTELGDLEKKSLADHNYRVITSMPGTENFMGEPTMPARNQNEVYLSKGIRVE